MVLYFITSNWKKVEEAKKFLDFEQLEIDVPEIQELDQKKIIEFKIKEAIKHLNGSVFCEETGLYIEALNGFPGPLIKWLIKSIGAEGIAKLVKNYDNNKAYAKTIIGYSDGEKIQYFEGVVKGRIVMPKVNGYGWDPIFMPDGYDKTFADMGLENKNRISMRAQAFNKLREFLLKKDNKNI